MYTTVPVPKKAKDIIFCPYCDKYKEIETVEMDTGYKDKGCNSCGITLKDYHMARVNQTIKGSKK